MGVAEVYAGRVLQKLSVLGRRVATVCPLYRGLRLPMTSVGERDDGLMGTSYDRRDYADCAIEVWRAIH